MVNYLNGRIYKITNDIDDMIYVGSTTLPLSRRWACHVQDCKKGRFNMRLHQHMRANGPENFHIVLIKLCPCEDREALLREERCEIEKIDQHICLNKRRPFVTAFEKIEESRNRYERNREHRINKVKQYYIQNKEYKLEYQRRYESYNHIMKQLPFYRVPLNPVF